MHRILTFVVLLQINSALTSCGKALDVRIDKLVGDDFALDFGARFRGCKFKDNPKIYSSVPKATFIPHGEHIGDRFIVSEDRYLVVKSDFLAKQYLKNNDGSGGEGHLSAFLQPNRVNVDGVIIKGRLTCNGKRVPPSDSVGFIFIHSYGNAVPNPNI